VKAKQRKMIARIWTIGHSTRKIDIFLSLLEENGIKAVADVRMFPGSKRYPQFGREALAKSLGADAVLDYTTEQAPPTRKQYDVFLDAVGKRKTSPLRAACLNALAPGGRAISVDDGLPRMNATNLVVLKDLVDAGKLRPVIDRSYPLEQIAEAHRYVEQDHKRGNVVITIRHAHA